MIGFKEDVTCEGVKAITVIGMMHVAVVLSRLGYDCVITSIKDGTHKQGSLHSRGYAFDLRNKHIPVEARAGVLQHLRAGVPQGFYVQQEPIPPHYHIEWDPDNDGGKSLP